MRIEYRNDMSDQKFFTKSSGTTPKITNEAVKNQSTFTIGFIWAFTTKAQ